MIQFRLASITVRTAVVLFFLIAFGADATDHLRAYVSRSRVSFLEQFSLAVGSAAREQLKMMCFCV